ncbi:orexin receptor type 2-like [Gigantopelta aegis]|uniref:orexin receptor type 2-like n=1 Tax=Gigantopelta aegis TaxID=1735272 RepID=UPI001B88C5CD|nr:orexin receptor type 2-like [Gigantopelta aegis]
MTAQNVTTSSADVTTMIKADEYLQSLNDEFALTIISAIVFLAAILVVGFVGNIIVCYIYLAKFKVSTTRCFVVTLALFDLLTCCIAIPGELVDMRENYTLRNVGMCKILRFCNSFSTVGSGAVLLAIAVDRYRKICKPLSKQMTIRLAQVGIGLGCLFSLCVSWPALVLYGSRTATTKYSYINGTDCSTQDQFMGTLYPLVYNGVQFVIFAVSTCVLVILYAHIWRTVSKHVELSKNRVSFSVGKQQQRVRVTLGKTSSTSASDLSAPVTKDSEITNDVKRTTTMRFSKPTANTVTTESDSSQQKRTSMKTGRSARRRKSTREQQARKTTFMLFLITLVFVLSFLPHLGLMAARGIHKVMFDSLSPGATAAYNFFLRSYFINSASNPIIYGFCNMQFRMELKTLLGKVCRKT